MISETNASIPHSPVHKRKACAAAHGAIEVCIEHSKRTPVTSVVRADPLSAAELSQYQDLGFLIRRDVFTRVEMFGLAADAERLLVGMPHHFNDIDIKLFDPRQYFCGNVFT